MCCQKGIQKQTLNACPFPQAPFMSMQDRSKFLKYQLKPIELQQPKKQETSFLLTEFVAEHDGMLCKNGHKISDRA